MASFVVALTGASGAAYGLRLISELLKQHSSVEVIVSPAGSLILAQEAGLQLAEKESCEVTKELRSYLKTTYGLEINCGKLHVTGYNDLMSCFASGATRTTAMVVVPCSMGTMARIANGNSGNLIERAADCALKESTKLLLVPRETPLNQIHLENMLKVSKAGAKLIPAMPAFYTKPQTVDDMVDFVVGRVLDMLGVEHTLFTRWNSESK